MEENHTLNISLTNRYCIVCSCEATWQIETYGGYINFRPLGLFGKNDRCPNNSNEKILEWFVDKSLGLLHGDRGKTYRMEIGLE